MLQLLIYGLLWLAACTYDCTFTVFVLECGGIEVEGLPNDMTEEDCASVKDELDDQTAPFTELVCVEQEVARQDL